MSDDLFFCSKRRLEHFSKFMIVRLDQKRMIFQYIQQQIFCSIYHNFDILIFQTHQNPFINILRQSRRNTARQNQYISCLQGFQLLKQLLDRCFCNLWSLSVDLCLLSCVDLDIDPCLPVCKRYKICLCAKLQEHLLQCFSCESRSKSKCCTLQTQIGKDHRNIDSFSSRINCFTCCPVDFSRHQLFCLYYIV